VLQGLNSGVRFLLELAALGATGSWGWQTGSGVGRPLLAIAAPLAVAVVWGLLLAPRARWFPPLGVRVGLEVAVFGSAAAALADVGHRTAAVALAGAATVSCLLLHLWRQDEQARRQVARTVRP
jgi:Protein of unknown function (DUF2568)